MPDSYTHKKLPEVEDSAPGFGLAEVQEARFGNDDLQTQDTGFAYHRLKAGRKQGFAHKHQDAEEVYVVLAGSGRMKLDDDVIDLAPLDAIRVAPAVTRMFEAGPDGLDVLVFGPRRKGDGEIVREWWTD